MPDELKALESKVSCRGNGKAYCQHRPFKGTNPLRDEKVQEFTVVQFLWLHDTYEAKSMRGVWL